jgi:hypothetical protein
LRSARDCGRFGFSRRQSPVNLAPSREIGSETVPSRREEALSLADELLADIELARLAPGEIARKSFRLARLLDDAEAMTWLRFEVGGYPNTGLTPDAWAAATRSNRLFINDKGEERAHTSMLGQLQTNLDGALAQIAAAADRPVSLSSANPYQRLEAPTGNTMERSAMRNHAAEQKAVLDKVLGSIHEYVTARHFELRFGAAAESAFEVVRNEVDARVADLVPEAPAMLAAAFESAASNNPEHWAGAAATCRRLLKAAADALRPPGNPVSGRIMTDAAYINRLVDWIVSRSESETARDLIVADLEYLGRRIDAVDGAGQKGAHATVTRLDAARFITATYLLLGDVLGLAADSVPSE